MCSKCQKKMDKGEITTFDIDLTREFLELEKKNAILKDVSFLRAIDYGDLVIFIVGQGDKARLENQPEILTYFKKKFEIQKIQLVEFSSKLGQYVENLIAPAKMLGFDQFFVPTGATEYHARIDRNTKDRLLLSEVDLAALLSELTGKTVSLKFE
ncbi:MAG: transcription elongation factor NusA-like protein [Promethearchaeota archaeon CR_4]|nr:MAG: transcription elongation factor NusA-like protein [Candidatus Lokiarchaeota archaeon CR_4]